MDLYIVEQLLLAIIGKVGENNDTIRRSIIRSIVHQERKLDRRSRSECLDLQLSPERLLLRSH